jgi:hypothetical protein
MDDEQLEAEFRAWWRMNWPTQPATHTLSIMLTWSRHLIKLLAKSA